MYGGRTPYAAENMQRNTAIVQGTAIVAR
jgi:hypothetical protein